MENVSIVTVNTEPPTPKIINELPLQTEFVDDTTKSTTEIMFNDSPLSTENNSLEDYQHHHHHHNHKMDTSDEDAPKVYNILMGKPIVSSNKANQSTPDNFEIVENIKNESKEVLDATPTAPTINEPKYDSRILINKNLENLQRTSEPSSRAESPLWTYTLPAPLKFADGDTTNATVPSDSISSETVITSETQTIVSGQSSAVPDSPIRPIIQQRLPLDFQAFNDTASTIASEGDDPRSDAYNDYTEKFSREALLESLERRRDQFIENEFDFLTKHEQDGESIADDLTEVKNNQRNLVLEELSQTLQNGPTLSRINQREIEAAVNTNNKLSNFTIQTYSGDIKPLTSSSSNTTAEVKKIEAVSILPPSDDVESIIRKHADPNFYGSTELTSPSKRKNSTERLPTNRINRSDSFHSTRIDEPLNGLTPRSLSYITLIGTQKFESNLLQRNLQFTEPGRRKSTSIADLPSLQSVEVMKSILSNSRKNSCSNGTGNGGDPIEIEITEPIEKEVKTVVPVIGDVKMQGNGDDSSSKENSPKNKMPVQLKQSPATAPVEGKQWRYQGPPAINLSTWSERPRKLVPIRTETDIRTQVNKTDMSSSVTNEIKKLAPVQIKETALPTDTTHLPIVLGVVKKTTPQEIKPVEIIQPTNRISYEISTLISTEKPKGYMAERIVHNTMTLGRVPIPNRFSLHQPKSVVATTTIPAPTQPPKTELLFKVNSPVTTSITINSSPSSKDGDSDSGYKSMPAVTLFNGDTSRKPIKCEENKDEKEFSPFSQLSLRKTGLKEKILADAEQKKVTPVTLRGQEQQSGLIRPVSMPVQMHIKPATTNSNITLMAIRPVETLPAITTPPVVVKISPKIEVISASVPAPPPPPLVPTIKAITVKQKLPNPQVDPHDQLLDSIRNFSKANLRKK